MSIDLNAELAALRHLVLNSKDDLARYRAAHSDDCVSAVMGPAASEGRMGQAFAKSAVEEDELLQQLLASCDDKDSACTKVAAAMCAAASLAADRVVAKAIDILHQRIGPNLLTCSNKLESSIDDIATKTMTIISEAEARSNVVSAARAAANRVYKDQWAAIDKQAAMITGYDKRLKALSDDISTACESAANQEELGSALTMMHSTQKIIKQQRENATHVQRLAASCRHVLSPQRGTVPSDCGLVRGAEREAERIPIKPALNIQQEVFPRKSQLFFPKTIPTYTHRNKRGNTRRGPGGLCKCSWAKGTSFVSA